ncbi:MAG: RelA/SpoT domain-containing protein, partial [Candidatus Saccharimonadales bacterium]
MIYPPKPDYSKGEIDRAGRTACSNDPNSLAYIHAVKVIGEWRVSHGYPMHTFNVSLRHKAFAIDKKAIVARRLKRLLTILDKIGARENDMRLSRMQDVGGVRAIMSTVDQVYQLVDYYKEPGRFSHVMKIHHDYIATPKE